MFEKGIVGTHGDFYNNETYRGKMLRRNYKGEGKYLRRGNGFNIKGDHTKHWVIKKESNHTLKYKREVIGSNSYIRGTKERGKGLQRHLNNFGKSSLELGDCKRTFFS